MRKTKPCKITSGSEARSRLVKGAAILSKVAQVTYGPHGQTVLLDRAAGILATKDGVTVAREVRLPDAVASLGCQALKDTCLKVNAETGDGTTTTALVTSALLTGGHKLIEAGVDPILLTRGLQEAAAWVAPLIQSLSCPVEDLQILERVALVASNGDEEIASKLAEATMATGKEGVLSIEEGYSTGIELVFCEGMELDQGRATHVLSPATEEEVLEGPLVAVVRGCLTSALDVETLLYEASGFHPRPLLVFAEWFGTEAIATFHLNRETVRAQLVRMPGVGAMKQDYAKDIAALANATFVDRDAGLNHLHFESAWFGAVRKARVGLSKTILVAYDDHDGVEKRVQELQAQERQSSSDFLRDLIRKRIATLTGGMAILRVGDASEAALRERRARIEDALGAVRAALRSGVVPGAGTAYLEASDALRQHPSYGTRDAYGLGFRLLAESLETPLRALAQNAGMDSGSVIYRVREGRRLDETGWLGWDALSDTVRDLGERPMVLDPTAVATAVLQAAVSTASTLLRASVVITRND